MTGYKFVFTSTLRSEELGSGRLQERKTEKEEGRGGGGREGGGEVGGERER